MYANIKEGGMGGEDGADKSNRIVTVEVLKKKENGNMGQQQEAQRSGSPLPGAILIPIAVALI